jgi:hypothetical protein
MYYGSLGQKIKTIMSPDVKKAPEQNQKAIMALTHMG